MNATNIATNENNPEPLNARETLENVAGTTDEKITETENAKREETVAAATAPAAEPTISSPEVHSTPEVGSQQVEIPVPTPEILPEGVTDRINYVIEKHGQTGQATVEVTPNELMDYVKSSITIPGGRITEGKFAILNDSLKIQDVTVQTPLGKAVISADLVDDASQGLHLDAETLDTKLDFLLRTQGGKIKEAASTLTDKIKTHFNEKITDPNWESSVMHVNGDKIYLTFVKKTTT